MTDIDLVVYTGVLVVFVAFSAAIGIAMVLVFSAVAVITGIRTRRGRPAPASAPGVSAVAGARDPEWFWRHEP